MCQDISLGRGQVGNPSLRWLLGFSASCHLSLSAGSNNIGQLGDGTFEGRTLPVNVTAVGSVRKATFLAAGYLHSCVAINFGSEPAMCWG